MKNAESEDQRIGNLEERLSAIEASTMELKASVEELIEQRMVWEAPQDNDWYYPYIPQPQDIPQPVDWNYLPVVPQAADWKHRAVAPPSPWGYPVIVPVISNVSFPFRLAANLPRNVKPVKLLPCKTHIVSTDPQTKSWVHAVYKKGNTGLELIVDGESQGVLTHCVPVPCRGKVKVHGVGKEGDPGVGGYLYAWHVAG